jgi:hypothetical protein
MDDRMIVLTYLLHKGDFYRSEAKKALDKLRNSKYLTSEDLEQIYKAVRADEIFDSIQHDLCKLLNIIP